MPGLRKRLLAVMLVAGAAVALGPVAVRASDEAPNINRLDLSGYKIEAMYTLGSNTGSTFQQTYNAAQVQGVPVAGPYVGTVFPPSDYVALSVAPNTVYIGWRTQSPTRSSTRSS